MWHTQECRQEQYHWIESLFIEMHLDSEDRRRLENYISLSWTRKLILKIIVKFMAFCVHQTKWPVIRNEFQCKGTLLEYETHSPISHFIYSFPNFLPNFTICCYILTFVILSLFHSPSRSAEVTYQKKIIYELWREICITFYEVVGRCCCGKSDLKPFYSFLFTINELTRSTRG